MSKLRAFQSAILISSMLILTSGCANLAPPPTKAQDKGGAGSSATAKSVADFGGMENLVAAAKKEGTLNVIALPPDWANYGAIMQAFTAKYGIKINSAQPDANSQDEINAGKQLAGGDRAPDVYDLGSNVAIANTDVLAPYKVVAWDEIPASLKEASGRHVSDYTGFMSVGYDASKLPAPRTMADLLKPE